ncbi:MAG: hypothetical protein KGZ71_08475 [Desulfobulbaceae bacterium]|nr:hypothetical protein [Candidatus Kapabacteria bacterium]MBS4000501.1 hypothetical protein [Desulfobulbaceae bacterium]
MKRFILVMCTFCFILIACEKGTTPQIIDTSVLIPLKLGNSWVYKEIDYWNPVATTSQFSLTVDSAVQFQGETHYKMRITDIQTDETMIIDAYFINKADGHHFIYIPEDGEPDVTLFKYPTFDGEIISEDEYFKFYVESVNAEYTTPAGKFKCIKYVSIVTIDGKEYEKTINYIAPGIGRIADETYDKSPNLEDAPWNLTSISTLMSYKLK